MLSSQPNAIRARASSRTAYAAGAVEQKDAMPLGEKTPALLTNPRAYYPRPPMPGAPPQGPGTRISHDHPHGESSTRTTGSRRLRLGEYIRCMQSVHICLSSAPPTRRRSHEWIPSRQRAERGRGAHHGAGDTAHTADPAALLTTIADGRERVVHLIEEARAGAVPEALGYASLDGDGPTSSAACWRDWARPSGHRWWS